LYGSSVIEVLNHPSVCVAADVNEVLLVDDRGAVEEGMSSNFFAVTNGVVHTADEGVLKGTVRELVLEVCVGPGTERTQVDIRLRL
jgi:branched-subunit amino acid aminotransferase/4-amino-4-deoxychorismate lyase